VLACDDQRGPQVKGAKGMRKRRKLYRFGPRADDQPNIRGLQIPP
jgi:hypothetical protein